MDTELQEYIKKLKAYDLKNHINKPVQFIWTTYFETNKLIYTSAIQYLTASHIAGIAGALTILKVAGNKDCHLLMIFSLGLLLVGSFLLVSQINNKTLWDDLKNELSETTPYDIDSMTKAINNNNKTRDTLAKTFLGKIELFSLQASFLALIAGLLYAFL